MSNSYYSPSVARASSAPGTGAPPRRRLAVDERRDELLRAGMELFSTRAYEEIWVEEIAERAGVSRGLLYHYFPTKRDFYVAVTQAAAAEAGQLTEPDPALPVAEQLHAGIEAFVGYAERHSQGFLTAYRGSLAGDPEVRAIVEQGRRRQMGRILDRFSSGASPSPALRLAVRGWIAYAQEIIAQWLEQGEPSSDTVCRLLERALVATVEAAQAEGPGS